MTLKPIIFTVAVLAGVQLAGAAVAETARQELGNVVPGTITLKGKNGVLYSRNELEHLATGALTPENLAIVSKASKKNNADPLPAIRDFNDSLKSLGIKLLVVPVPPKLAVMPEAGLKQGEAMENLRELYSRLRKAGVEVIDLYEPMAAASAPAFCRQDAHWSASFLPVAAQIIAEKLNLPKGGEKYAVTAPVIKIAGDLQLSLDPKSAPSEEQCLQVISGRVFDDSSPVLVIGDSHTLVFSSGGDMLAESAGICEQLALTLGMPVERIGIKGSASTATRINLYRKSAKNPAWLKNKKAVVWIFSCREFSESANGWAKIPVLKK